MSSNTQHMECDLLIAGAGISGMTAAARAAAFGIKTIVAGSSSGFYLLSGLFDLLGVYPMSPPTLLKNPQEGITKLKKEITGHPYSKVRYQKILETFDLLKEFLDSSGLPYISRKNRNMPVLTSVGTFKPSFLVPQTMAKSSQLLERNTSLLLVDFKGFKGYSAAQIAAVLDKKGISAETLSIALPDFSGDFNPVRLADEFEKPGMINYIAEKIRPYTRGKELIGLPAVCGINGSADLLAGLEDFTGRACFEIPGLPPSIPGLRLKNAFEVRLQSVNGVTLLNNAKISFKSCRDNSISVSCVSQNLNTIIKAKHVLLATGRFSGGGLKADRETIRESVFGVPVRQPHQRKSWHNVNLFHPEGHLVNQAGLQTDKTFRPLAENGEPFLRTLYAAGSILSHNDWTRLKSGSGVSCVSACRAVEHIYKNLRHANV